MAISTEFIAYVEELFAAVPGTRIRKMFGGIGIFRDGLMYALATSQGRIALKADDINRRVFEEEGASEWIYEDKRGHRKGMGYWYVPDDVADDGDAFVAWAEAAFAAAARIDASRPPGSRKLEK